MLAALAGASVLLVSGCAADDPNQIARLALPIPATEEAPFVAELWKWSWLAAMLVGIAVWALMAYVSFKFRRRSETEIPVQTRYNLPIEIFYTVAPIMMVIVYFFFTVRTQGEVLHDIDNPDHDVTVVGQKWSWTFNYQNEDAVGGKTVYDTGTPADLPQLYLVKDQSVEFHLFSHDVIHSFWVPAFLFKMDVVPGRNNDFGVTPNRAGTFQGRCAELCGTYHSRMLFTVKVVDQAEYDAHLRSLEAQGNVGLNKGGGDVTRVSGLKTESTSGGSQ